MKKALAVVTEKSRGEAVRRYLASIDALDFDLKIEVVDDRIYIPLSRQLSEEERDHLRRLCDFIIEEREFKEVPKRPKSIIEWLSDKMPPYLLASVPRSWDIIGDIAIVELPDELLGYEKLIAEAILAVHKNVKTVYAKAGSVSGDFRIRPLKLIGGEDKSITIHREHGAKLYVDVKNVYFSPRLATERKRVASQVRDGEIVLDMFSGVGPFAIQIALSKKTLVYAIELNPVAYKCLLKNIELNRLQDKVIPFLGDAKRVVEEHLMHKVDRIIMNLPERSLDYVDIALKALRGKGILHVYVFEEEPRPMTKAEKRVLDKIGENKWSVLKVPYVGLVKQVAPRRWQVVVDVEVRYSS
ncbi:MAG: class I SAM-dependent methyltransferase [Candidatus Nezhaarchaeales archaeon]